MWKNNNYFCKESYSDFQNTTQGELECTGNNKYSSCLTNIYCDLFHTFEDVNHLFHSSVAWTCICMYIYLKIWPVWFNLIFDTILNTPQSLKNTLLWCWLFTVPITSSVKKISASVLCDRSWHTLTYSKTQFSSHNLGNV